jgi:hypothetical protein
MICRRLCNDLQTDGGFAGRLRTEDFHDAATGNSTHAEGSVDGDAAGGDNGYRGYRALGSKAHDGSLAELLFDGCHCEIQRPLRFTV